MYTALYRKYRPKTFDEMVGQDHIVKILKNQIKTGNTAHAYLFCGTRGTGKTSAARIFAKGVNCLSKENKPCGKCENCESIQQGIFFDVIEIDAASNNRVDNIRELRESVKYPPAAGLCKVYIIDEVHMLSTGAFNALLKTLEEPPEHVIFILATTEPHKLPATILSRCLRLDFRRVSETKIKDKLRQICLEQNIQYEESALSLIAANGDGSVRDSLSILEQCIPAGEKTLLRKDVVDIMGTAGEEVFLEITNKVIEKDVAGAFLIVDKLAKDGKDMTQLIRDWIFHFRNLMMSKFADRLDDIMNMSCENVTKVKAQGDIAEMGFISTAISELSATANKARYSTQPRTLLELSILKLTMPSLSEDPDSIIQRIEVLENKFFELEKQSMIINPKTSDKYIKSEKNKLCETEQISSNEKLLIEKSKAKLTPCGETLLKEPKAKLPPQEEQYIETSNSELSPWEESYIEASDSELHPRKEPCIEASDSELPPWEEPCMETSDSKLPPWEEPYIESSNLELLSQKKPFGDKTAAYNLWRQALTKAIQEKNALRLLDKDVNVLNTDFNQITLEVGSSLKKNVVEQNFQILEKYLEQINGKKIKINVVMSDTNPDINTVNINDTKSQLKALLGADKLTFTE